MKKLKVVTIVGTRPEIVRLSRLIPKLDKITDHILVHTGQNYDPQLSEVFFKDLELRQPDYYLDVDTSTFGSVMGDTLKRSEEVLLKEKPDAVMILGDTNSAVAAVVAERLHIPVYHMEAGNRSFDENVPEELNRRMVDHVASFNLPYTEHARSNLLREGLHPRFVFKTGSPLAEVFAYYKEKIASSTILNRLQLEPRGFFLASFHRQENVDNDSRLGSIVSSLEELSEKDGIPVIISTHPRTRRRLEVLGFEPSQNLRFLEPFGYLDYNKLQLEAKLVLSDSGSIAEESHIMGLSSISIRESIERPEAIESGAILLAGTRPEDIMNNMSFASKSHSRSTDMDDYEILDFSNRVISILLSTANKASAWKNKGAARQIG